MFNIQSKRNILYVMTAILLLLQSFAVWHEVAHPFHIDEVQCERLSAINHLPSADLHSNVNIPHHFVAIETDNSIFSFTLPVRQREQHTIRAPPVIS